MNALTVDGGQFGVFRDAEADAWFHRNRRHLREWNADDDVAIAMIRDTGVRPRRVLEIGASTGYRVAALVDMFGCRGIAVDLSPAAVREGAERFAKIDVVQAPSHRLPPIDPVDLVILRFVFHWLDRRLLLPTYAEIDRVLEPGGLVIIGDFDPPTPCRVPYHHDSTGVAWTYKQDYAAPLLATGMYDLMDRRRVAYGAREEPVNAASPACERSAYSLLVKRTV